METSKSIYNFYQLERRLFMKKKFLKTYLGLFSVIVFITSCLYMTQLLDKLGLPYFFNFIYYLIHVGSFAAMLFYGKDI